MKLVSDEERTRLSRNLSLLMALRGMKQVALAEASGVTQAAVSLILRREAGPSIDTLAALAKALSVPVWLLLMPIDTIDDVEALPELQELWRAADEGGRNYIRDTAAREAGRKRTA